MANISKYFKKEGLTVKYLGDELNVYIPDAYFESSLAEVIGDRYFVFGLLSAKSTVNGKTEFTTINIPTFTNFYPSQVTTEKDEDGEKYHIMKFFKNSVVMDAQTRADSNVTQTFLKMLCRGKLPNTIAYDEYLNVWDTNLETNDVNFKVASVIKEIIIAEMLRTKGNPYQKYAKVKGKNPKADPYGYEPTNINKVCSMSSTFSAITFENMDEMIITSVNMKRYDKEQKDSPLEKIIKM